MGIFQKDYWKRRVWARHLEENAVSRFVAGAIVAAAGAAIPVATPARPPTCTHAHHYTSQSANAARMLQVAEGISNHNSGAAGPGGAMVKHPAAPW